MADGSIERPELPRPSDRGGGGRATDRLPRERIAAGALIAGQAYHRRATLEINGDALTWRAQRGPIPPIAENVVTTIHDLHDVRWVEHRWSLVGAILAVLGALWMFSEGIAWGAGTLAVATALTAWRRTHPRLFLVLDLADRRLIMKVALDSAAAARALVERIDRTLASGEAPAAPSTLP